MMKLIIRVILKNEFLSYVQKEQEENRENFLINVKKEDNNG